MLDFVPNHMAPGSPLGRRSPRVLCPWNRRRPGPGAPELYGGQAETRRFDPGIRPGSIFCRLAGYAAAQLRQPGHAGSDDRRAPEESRGSVTACGATWPCWSCRRSLNGHGASGPSPSGPKRPNPCGKRFRASASWPKSTGTWNGQCSSKDSTTHTTNGFTTGCAKGTRGRCESISIAELDYQNKLARFLENHDEPRAAATFSTEVHKAAAVITFLVPGLRFFHQGEFEGRKKTISPHLGRAPQEPVDAELKAFYERLLAVLRLRAVREGQWQLLECAPAWEGNWTWDCFLGFAWQGPEGARLIVTVNYAPNQSQCYVQLPFNDLGGTKWRLEDLMGDAVYDRDGDDLQSRGLYLDEPPWRASVFSLYRAS